MKKTENIEKKVESKESLTRDLNKLTKKVQVQLFKQLSSAPKWVLI